MIHLFCHDLRLCLPLLLILGVKFGVQLAPGWVLVDVPLLGELDLGLLDGLGLSDVVYVGPGTGR